jgi:coenzyme F420-0:L-glutamate ligase/coenzyme F420-1:gamma-L-glutamate ligase
MPAVDPESLHSWLRSRRSVRRFLPQPVAPDIIARILETATWAPNAHNRQPWRFVQLSSPESRAKLAGAMASDFERALQAEGLDGGQIAAQLNRSRDRIAEAPEAILLCLDTDVLDKYEDEGRSRGEYLMAVQSVALAGGQLLLAAHAQGLAGVWMCAPLFQPTEVQRALDLPESWEAQGLILLGWGKKEAPGKERLDIGRVKRVV